MMRQLRVQAGKCTLTAEHNKEEREGERKKVKKKMIDVVLCSKIGEN